MVVQIIGKGGFAREIESYMAVCFGTQHEIVKAEHNEISKLNLLNPTIIAIGSPNVRKKLQEENRFNYYRFQYDGTSFQFSDYEFPYIKKGTIVCPGTYMTVNVKLGAFVIVNLNCTIGHDTVIGDFVTVSPGVNISGNVKIGNLCEIGSNSVIREGITICDNVIIGAGSVVVKDITEPGTYVGNPVRKIK